jgi:streptomycin 6-kinase
MSTSIPIDVPDALIASQLKHGGAHGRAWIASLPRLITNILDRWTLRPDGPARHGMASLVLPVVCADAMAAALKLQPLDEENAGEPIGLRAWDGDGAVRRLDHDPTTGAMLLERRDATRPLSAVVDALAPADPRRVARALGRGSRAARPAKPGRHRRSHARPGAWHRTQAARPG